MASGQPFLRDFCKLDQDRSSFSLTTRPSQRRRIAEHHRQQLKVDLLGSAIADAALAGVEALQRFGLQRVDPFGDRNLTRRACAAKFPLFPP